MKPNESNDIPSGLDDKNKSAIPQLIDLKTEDDMEKVLAKMGNMFANVNFKMDSQFA